MGLTEHENFREKKIVNGKSLPIEMISYKESRQIGKVCTPHLVRQKEIIFWHFEGKIKKMAFMGQKGR